MALKKSGKIKISYIFIFILMITSLVLLTAFYIYNSRNDNSSRTAVNQTRSYHIIITGRYENQLFLQKMYEGARFYSDQYNAIVELYVPSSQAEDVPLQALLDYVSYVNADGVIMYNDTGDSSISVPYRTDGELIPMVTTGLYNSNLQQVSYIGTSYWELGKKIAEEIYTYLHGNGKVIIIGDKNLSTLNYSNLMNSLLEKLHSYKKINYSIIDDVNLLDSTDALTSSASSAAYSTSAVPYSSSNLVVCISEEDTIKCAQRLTELNPETVPGLLGLGSNETCQLYLEKGIISELIDVDANKIGETALKELFEYRNKGYANSYIASDVKILRSYN